MYLKDWAANSSSGWPKVVRNVDCAFRNAAIDWLVTDGQGLKMCSGHEFSHEVID
jgi:hypothetical protein